MSPREVNSIKFKKAIQLDEMQKWIRSYKNRAKYEKFGLTCLGQHAPLVVTSPLLHVPLSVPHPTTAKDDVVDLLT